MRKTVKNKTDEIWKDILGYEGFYQVSNTGRVRRIDKNEHLIRQNNNGAGYMRIALHKENETKNAYVHRLVATAFCLKPKGCNVVNHIDCNRANNNAENLEWTTPKCNSQWGAKMGNIKANWSTYYSIALASEARKKRVVAISKDGIERHFNSITDATNALGLSEASRKHISDCCNGKRKTCGGYKWLYETFMALPTEDNNAKEEN